MEPLSITALTTHVVSLFEQDATLRDVWLTGEVGTWKRAASGHIYFTLKDQGATINAVMWRGSARAHGWLPQAGDQVVAHGYVGVYPERGAYQLYANRLQPAGRGQLHAQFEALKATLAAQGLFDAERKRPVPSTARRIGVVTSPDAAALRDILRVLAERWPLAEAVLFGTLVQGSEAPPQIVRALAAANRYHAQAQNQTQSLDVILLARGGGSLEDLWAFNDERVARAVVESVLPVVVGVGHETDFTIADFVADLRAPTPTAAAAAVVPDRVDVREGLVAAQRWLARRADGTLATERRALDGAAQRLRRLHPQRQLDRDRQRLDDYGQRLNAAAQRLLRRRREQQRSALQELEALNPQRVLQRGYSIVQRTSTPAGHVEIISAPAQVQRDEELTVRAAGGAYRVRVAEAEE